MYAVGIGVRLEDATAKRSITLYIRSEAEDVQGIYDHEGKRLEDAPLPPLRCNHTIPDKVASSRRAIILSSRA